MEEENKVQSQDVETDTKTPQAEDTNTNTTEEEQNEMHRLRNLVNAQKEENVTLKDQMCELQEFMEDEECQRQGDEKNDHNSSFSNNNKSGDGDDHDLNETTDKVVDEVEEMHHALHYYEKSISEKDKQDDQFQDMVNNFEELLDTKEKQIDELNKSLLLGKRNNNSLHSFVSCNAIGDDEEEEENMKITEAEMLCSLRLHHDFMHEVEMERNKLFSTCSNKNDIENDLQDKISTIEIYESEKAEKNEVISKLEQENKEMKVVINEKDDNINNLESIILLLKEKLVEKESLIESKNSESKRITMKYSLKNKSLENELHNRSSTINAYKDKINENESKIKELTIKLLLVKITGDTSEQEVTWLEDVEEKEIIIADLNNELSDKNMKIADMEEDLGEKDIVISDLNQEISIQQEEIDFREIEFSTMQIISNSIISSHESDLHKIKARLNRVETSAAEKTERIIFLNRAVTIQKESIHDLQAEVYEIRTRSQRNLSDLIGKFEDSVLPYCTIGGVIR